MKVGCDFLGAHSKIHDQGSMELEIQAWCSTMLNWYRETCNVYITYKKIIFLYYGQNKLLHFLCFIPYDLSNLSVFITGKDEMVNMREGLAWMTEVENET